MQLPPDTLTLATVQSFIHTDNVYEAEEDRRESSGWVGLFGVSYVPYATPRWTPRVAFQQALVRFTKESAGDYDSQILSLLSSLRLSANQEWTWHGGFTLSRYSGRFGGGGEFYKYYSIDNSVTYRRALDARQSLQLFGAYWLSWRHTDPVEFSRIENALSLGLVYYPAPGLSIAPYVRPGLFLYTKDSSADTDRRDFHLNAGLAVSWTPLPQLAVGTGFNWTGNYSTSERRDYEELLPGVSLTLALGF